MKKPIAVIIIFAVIISFVKLNCSAVVLDNREFEFRFTSGGVQICGYNGKGGDVVIPESTKGLKVVSICKGAFEKDNSITAITIPGDIYIDRHAFLWCKNLTYIKIGAGVKISESAFGACQNIVDLIFDEGTETVQSKTFTNCKAKNIYLPKSLKRFYATELLEDGGCMVYGYDNGYNKETCEFYKCTFVDLEPKEEVAESFSETESLTEEYEELESVINVITANADENGIKETAEEPNAESDGVSIIISSEKVESEQKKEPTENSILDKSNKGKDEKNKDKSFADKNAKIIITISSIMLAIIIGGIVSIFIINSKRKKIE